MATVAILGHEGHGKSTLARAMGQQHPGFLISDPIDWTQAGQWSAAILVVSAPDGLMPGSRDAVQTAGRQGVRKLAVFLSKCDLIDAGESELLDLVEMEIREMLTKYHLPGDSIVIVRGSAQAALAGDRTPAGMPAIAQVIAAAAALSR